MAHALTPEQKPKSNVQNIIEWLLIGLFAASVLFLAYGGVFHHFLVSGNSMFPTYKNGDLVVSVKQADYAVDDIVIYGVNTIDCQNCMIVHRIIEIDSGEGYTLQGDNNNFIDPITPTTKEIMGKVIIHLPLGEFGFSLFNPWLWRITFGSVIFYMALNWYLYTRRKAKAIAEDKRIPRPSSLRELIVRFLTVAGGTYVIGFILLQLVKIASS